MGRPLGTRVSLESMFRYFRLRLLVIAISALAVLTIARVGQSQVFVPPSEKETVKDKPEPTVVMEAVVSDAEKVETTAKRVVSVSGSCEQYRGLVNQYPWSVDIAMAVMQAESTQNGIPCNKDAKSRTDDHGLFQINHGDDIYGPIIYDPAFNVKIAYTEKYAKGGWGHWTVCNNGTVKCW
ncbi:MAG: hypothetical protein A2Y57_04200 [Candidatus Woykebacteria bacterium RBG_13_40_7b]|uniref:Transglycosylase SLT domain-containing protein n=1 Tax=Candidatus Woykebacteria bacterium RBG_13_40_7b TaxID=1802594 RepID=A0A1G1WAA6_9BACT|nr:MAG: hypothetical protein A2Y57_04200 [Candidatus Woykebacteria bacterium RBG_13_40_7b]